jgi:hypothetical protein
MSDPSPALPADQIRRYATGALRAAGVNGSTVLPIPLADIASAAGLQRESLFDSIEEQDVPPAFQGILQKIQGKVLGALSIPERRVFVDDGQAAPRARFTEAHEIGHDALPWHRDAYYGDNHFTLERSSEAGLEAEANLFAADILFGIDRFTEQADSYRPSLQVPLGLNGDYLVSAQAAVRRYAERSKHAVGLFVVGRYLSAGSPSSLAILQTHQSDLFVKRYGPLRQCLRGGRLSSSTYPGLEQMAVEHPAHVAESTVTLDTSRGKVHFRAEGFSNGRVGMVLLTRKQPTLGRPLQLVDAHGRPLR